MEYFVHSGPSSRIWPDFGRENARKSKKGNAMENADGTVPPTDDIAGGTENINKEIEVSLTKKIKIRGSMRGAATKLRNRIGERLADGTFSVDTFYLKDNIQTIKQKIESLRKLDEEIIDLMASCDDDEVEGRMETEIEGSDSVRTDLNRIVDRMEDALKQLSPPPPIQQQMPTQGQRHHNFPLVRRRLRKQPDCLNWK